MEIRFQRMVPTMSVETIPAVNPASAVCLQKQNKTKIQVELTEIFPGKGTGYLFITSSPTEVRVGLFHGLTVKMFQELVRSHKL